MSHKITILTEDKVDHRLPLSMRMKNPASKIIDWDDRSDRKWLESHLHWAVHNDKKITIVPTSITVAA